MLHILDADHNAPLIPIFSPPGEMAFTPVLEVQLPYSGEHVPS